MTTIQATLCLRDADDKVLASQRFSFDPEEGIWCRVTHMGMTAHVDLEPSESLAVSGGVLVDVPVDP